MLRKVKIGTSVLTVLAAVAIGAVTVCGYTAYGIASHALEEESFNKLTAVREMKGSQIEDYFKQIRNQVLTFSENPMVVQAMQDFRRAFNHLPDELEQPQSAMDPHLRTYYQEEFLPRLNNHLEQPASWQNFWPHPVSTRALQYLYIAANPNATGKKHHLDAAPDNSRYSRHHARYHPVIRSYLEKFGYYDIFLVDAESGHIVYSVFKEVDTGTSLLLGPYSHTHFAAAFRAARNASDKNFVKLVDFAPYTPSYNAQASFIASPIFSSAEKIGVVLFQMPVDRINAVMTNHQAWAKVGLGQSGETYLVGPDYTLRNQSRFLIEDRDNYLQAIRKAGLSEFTIHRIDSLNSSIGLQKVRTAGTEAALAGESGTQIFPDYRGVPVLSSYRPLEIPGLNWAIMSEMDASEAFRQIDNLRLGIIIWLIIIIIAIVFIAVIFTRRLTQPLNELTINADQLAQGRLDVIIDTRGRDEISELAKSFAVMRDGLKRLIGELEDVNQNLEHKVNERTEGVERSYEHMQMIVKFAPDAIIGLDERQQILFCNTATENMFGYRAEEVKGEPVKLLIAEQYRPNYGQLLTDFERSGAVSKPLSAGLYGQHKDGTTFPTELGLLKVVVHGERRFTLFCRDITERRHMEKLLKHTLESHKQRQ